MLCVSHEGYDAQLADFLAAAALTAGLAASFLNLADQGQLKNDDGTIVRNTPQSLKDHIVKLSWSRADAPHPGEAPRPRNGIWNGIDRYTPMDPQICKWIPDSVMRSRRRQSGPMCQSPLSNPPTSVSSFVPDPSKMPTLTAVATTIVTPSGSSCVATATATQCAMGPRGQSACIQAQTCASWTASATQAISKFTPAPSDLPTLPGVGISTPAGSSCLTTTTATKCVIGSGGKSVCVPTPACATWIAISDAVPSTPPSPSTPLEVKPVVCNDERDFPGHGDISPGAQSTGADTTCIDRPVPDLGPGQAWNASIQDANGINMFYSINWNDGCVTSGPTQPMNRPLGSSGPSCQELLVQAYDECKHEDVLTVAVAPANMHR